MSLGGATARLRKRGGEEKSQETKRCTRSTDLGEEQAGRQQPSRETGGQGAANGHQPHLDPLSHLHPDRDGVSAESDGGAAEQTAASTGERLGR